MSNLTRESRVDKTGKTVARWVKTDDGGGSATESIPAPSVASADRVSAEDRRFAVGSILEESKLDISEDIEWFVRSASDDTMAALYQRFVVDGDQEAAWQVAWLAKEEETDRTILEYLALYDIHEDEDEIEYTTNCIRGLHLPERNRDSMDISDSSSVERNRALLRFVLAACLTDDELGTDFLEYRNETARQPDAKGIAIADDGIVDLICDNVERVDELISLVSERGNYGVDLFEELLEESPSPLNPGRL